jgi:hypothetical protein
MNAGVGPLPDRSPPLSSIICGGQLGGFAPQTVLMADALVGR